MKANIHAFRGIRIRDPCIQEAKTHALDRMATVDYMKLRIENSYHCLTNTSRFLITLYVSLFSLLKSCVLAAYVVYAFRRQTFVPYFVCNNIVLQK